MTYYKSIDEKLYNIEKAIETLKHLNPINAEEEKTKFISAIENNTIYNPQFKYRALQSGNLLLKRTLLSLIINKKDNLGMIFNDKRYELIEILYLLENVGEKGEPKLFIHCSSSLYPVLDGIVENAYNILEKVEPQEEKEKNIPASQVKKILEDVLKKINVNDWYIEINSDFSAGINVNPKLRKISIADRAVNKAQLKRYEVHEIGNYRKGFIGHVLRHQYGANQPYKIFQIGLQGYLSTEKGLTIYNEEKAGVFSNNVLREYAAKTVAVNSSLEKSFYEVYKELLKYVPKEVAYRTTQRAKRGLSDTAGKGGYTKDIVYLQGYYDVKKYIEEENDITLLYVGKVGLKHVQVVKELLEEGVLKKPKETIELENEDENGDALKKEML